MAGNLNSIRAGLIRQPWIYRELEIAAKLEVTLNLKTGNRSAA